MEIVRSLQLWPTGLISIEHWNGKSEENARHSQLTVARARRMIEQDPEGPDLSLEFADEFNVTDQALEFTVQRNCIPLLEALLEAVKKKPKKYPPEFPGMLMAKIANARATETRPEGLAIAA